MFWHIKLPCCFFGEQIECLYISLCSYLVYINTHVTLLRQTKTKRPVGTGTVKAVVNVFGARQFHPLLQRSMVESFYVQFYSEYDCIRLLSCADMLP